MENYNIVKYNFGTDNTHWVYIPKNIKKDTEIIYVAFNDKRSKTYNNKWQALEEGILKYGEDKIIVYPENPDLNPGHQNYQIESNKVFHEIKEDYNLETNQFINVGHSAGSGWTLKNLTTYLRENPNVERQTLFLVDSQLDKKFTDEEMGLIKENNTMIISYCQPYRRNHEIQKLAERTELPILFVEDPDIPQNSNNSWEYYHNVVVENFFTKGLYNSLTDFSQGKGELPEGFTYKMYNPKTGQIETIDRKEVAAFLDIKKTHGINYLFYDLDLEDIFHKEKYTLENISSDASNKYGFLNDLKEYNVYSLSNSVMSSNMQYVQNFANGLVKSIKSDSLFDSTTINIAGGIGPLMDIINECLTLYYDSVGHLLDSLAKESAAIVSYGQTLVDLDTHLDKEIEETIAPSVDTINLSGNINNNVQVSNTNVVSSSLSSLSSSSTTLVNDTVTVSTMNEQVKTEIIEDNSIENITEETSNENNIENKLYETEVNNKENKEEIKAEEKKENNNQEETKQESLEKNNGEQTTLKEDTKNNELDINKNQNNTPSSAPNNNNNNSYSSNKNHSTNTNVNTTTEVAYNKGNYNVIFETKGNEVISMKYQYNYNSYETALSNYELLLVKLKDNINIENIILNGNRIEIIFKNDVYKNISINELLEQSLIGVTL